MWPPGYTKDLDPLALLHLNNQLCLYILPITQNLQSIEKI